MSNMLNIDFYLKSTGLSTSVLSAIAESIRSKNVTMVTFSSPKDTVRLWEKTGPAYIRAGHADASGKNLLLNAEGCSEEVMGAIFMILFLEGKKMREGWEDGVKIYTLLPQRRQVPRHI